MLISEWNLIKYTFWSRWASGITIKQLTKFHYGIGMEWLYVLHFPWFQEKVACLDDNDARLAKDPHNKYKIQVDFI